MAKTLIQRIEKEFYLKGLFDRRLPLSLRFKGEQYTLLVVSNLKGRLCLQANRPVKGLRSGSRMDLLFDFYGKKVQFSVEAAGIRGNLITTAREVDILRKDLERSFTRVAPPEGLRAAFELREERYELNYPRINAYEPVLPPAMAEKDLWAVVQGLRSWAGKAADGQRVVFFSKAKARRLEERLVAGTGLTLYIPSPGEGLAKKYPGTEGRVMSRELFLGALARLGYEAGAAGKTLDAFIKAKADRGVYSEVWTPIRFQEYVLGYVWLWTTRKGKPPLSYQAVETAAEYTKGIAWAFKEGGQFESLRAGNEAFEGRVLDISASGLRFSYPPPRGGLSLPAGVELGVTLEGPGWSVKAGARVVRRVAGRVEMGCRFAALGADEQRLLFEYLYGEPFSAGGNPFLAGQV